MEDARLEERKRGFKPVDTVDYLKSREEHVVVLRKKKIDELIRTKRTKTNYSNEDQPNGPQAVTPEIIGQKYSRLVAMDSQLSDESLTLRKRLKLIMELIDKKASSRSEVLEIISFLRMLVSTPDTPNAIEFLESGLVQKAMEMMSRDLDTDVLTEVSWFLSNLSSVNGAICENIRQYGIPKIVDSLKREGPHVENCLWLLANISGENVQCRDEVLKCGAPTVMHTILQKEKISLKVAEVLSWLASNLSKGRPSPPPDAVRNLLSTALMFLHCEVNEAYKDSLWTLSYLTESDTYPAVEKLIETGNADKVLEPLKRDLTNELAIPSLRILGNIFSSCAEATFQCEAVKIFTRLLDMKTIYLMKEGLWALSNLLASTETVVQDALDAEIIDKLFTKMREPDFEIRRETAHCILNSLEAASNAQIHTLVEKGLLPIFLLILKEKDAKLIASSLYAIDKVLGVKKENEDNEPFADKFAALGGLDRFEELQMHPNPDIYKLVVKVMEKHYDLEEEAEVEGDLEKQKENVSNNKDSAKFKF